LFLLLIWALPVVAQAGHQPNFNAGLRTMIFPSGQLDQPAGHQRQIRAAAAAIGFSPFIEGVLSPYLSIGAGAEVRFNIRPVDGFFESPGHGFNLSLRLKAGLPLLELVQVYALVTPAYSMLLRPGEDNATGPAVGLAGGLAVIRSRDYRPFIEAGYEWGFQRLGPGRQLSTKYVVLVAGVQVGL
jgi:hypothetical protein